MSEKILVGIADDHQTTIDGYLYRLAQNPTIQVEFTSTYGYEIQQMLAEHKIKVLLLDIGMPTSPDNPNPYPVLHIVPESLHKYPTLQIIVVTMYCEKSLINAVMLAGSSGYILKDDMDSMKHLDEIIVSVATGKKYLSKSASLLLNKKDGNLARENKKRNNYEYWLGQLIANIYQSPNGNVLWLTLVVLILFFCILVMTLPR